MEAVGNGGRRDDRLPRRRQVLQWILASGLLASAGIAGAQRASGPGLAGPARARGAELPVARDLAADAASAAERRAPLLLFFDRDNCPYCEQALREHLVPLSRAEPWRDDAIFRQIDIDKPMPVVDFSGRATTHRDVAQRYRVSLSPTVIVVDARGEPLAEPVVGLLTADFYGAYLERALEQARAALRNRTAQPVTPAAAGTSR